MRLLTLLLLTIAACAEPNPRIGAGAAGWKKMAAGDDEAVVPQSRTVTYPGAGDWATINKRVGTVTPPAADDDE